MEKEDKVLDHIREDIRDWYQYFAENIARYREMKSFNAGNQWTWEISQEYQNQQKEPLVLNLSSRFIKKVVGEMLTNSPQIKLTAQNTNLAGEVVDLKNDVIRTICHRENFDEAKQAAFTDALSGGWGIISLYTEYAPGITFDQVVKIKTENDATLGFFDVAATKPTKADGRYAGTISFIPKKEFMRRWPKKEPSTKSFIPEDIDVYTQPDAVPMVQVADYYKKVYKKVKIVKVAPTLDGKESEDIKKSDWPNYLKKFDAQEKQRRMLAELSGGYFEPRERPQIYQERVADLVTVKCIRCTYDQILEEYDWPSEYLPVIFVPGAYTYLQGIQHTASYTEDVVDIQRFINYLWSEIVIYIRRARKEGFIGTPQMVEGREDMWRNPERVQGILLGNFDARLANGPGGGLPIPLTAIPTIPPVLIELYNTAVETMMQIIGQTQASLGLQGNERSGKAIEMRRMQENYNTTSNYQYLMYATEQVGLVINDLVNNLYDSERTMMLRRKDGSDYIAVINKYNSETDDVENNITEVSGLISVDAGSNYEQQRQEERDFMAAICNLSNTPAFPVMGDLMAKTTKMEITNDVVKRLEFMQPPALKAFLKGQPAPPAPPNPMAQIEMGKLQVQQQQNALKQQQIQTDQQKNQIEALNNLLDFRSTMAGHAAEIKKATLETHKTIETAKTHRVKHAADIVQGFNALMQSGKHNSGGSTYDQPQ